MAWRAELKRRNWYCICGEDMPLFFKKYLYDKWYASLSKEEKEHYEKKKEEKAKKEEKEAIEAIANLACMSSMMLKIADKKFPW